MSVEKAMHKVVSRWAQALQAVWAAGVAARRAHAIAVWGDEPDPAWRPRPDHLYRCVRTAWSSKA